MRRTRGLLSCGWSQAVDGAFDHAKVNNLAAQDGLFTIMSGPGARRIDTHVEQCIEDCLSGSFPPGPAMYRISISQEECFALLEVLAGTGISGSTMFPGVDGVVQGLRERHTCEERRGW
jgi:hypothetical protein